jgi:hypothetical protein
MIGEDVVPVPLSGRGCPLLQDHANLPFIGGGYWLGHRNSSMRQLLAICKRL